MRNAFRIAAKDGATALRQAFVQSLLMFGRNGLQNHAAATALYFLLSAAPLLILLAWAAQSLAVWAPDSVSAGVLLAALYEQFHLHTLAEMGIIPAQRNLSASGVGVVTLLLASRGLLNAVRGAVDVIFAGERQRHVVVAWFIPLLAVPLALMLLGVALVSDQLLKFLLAQGYLAATKGAWVDGLNSALIGLIAYGLIFAAYSRLPAERPAWRPTAVFAALSLLSLVVLFSVLGLFFQISQFQQIYGAIGGVVFILITSYTAALLFYFWAQFLRTYQEVDVRALEQLIIADAAARRGNLAQIPGMERLLHRFGREFGVGDCLIHEGDRTDKSTFFIFSGSVRLTRHGENTQEHRLIDLSTGAMFGEMAYLLGEGRTATATAITPVLVLVLPPEMLETLMRQSSRVSRDIIQALCVRLENMNQTAAKT